MLKDLQSENDARNISISNVGICDYQLPIALKLNSNVYNSICTISCNVSLDETSRGAHLSRIIETVNDYIFNKEITLEDLNKIISVVVDKTNTKCGLINLNFDIITKKISPVSKKDSFSTVHFSINNSVCMNNIEKSVSVSLLGTTLCPCSKEISEYGAHNQKCKATITLFGNYEKVNFDKLFEIIDGQFSSSIYSTVKREDEKYMTEQAYNNPKFSEDLIRDLLINVGKIYDDEIVAEIINYESIHEHNVYAKGSINHYEKVLRK